MTECGVSFIAGNEYSVVTARYLFMQKRNGAKHTLRAIFFGVMFVPFF
jgi:hypothetical protein